MDKEVETLGLLLTDAEGDLLGEMLEETDRLTEGLKL